jgi:hypothetical protein
MFPVGFGAPVLQDADEGLVLEDGEDAPVVEDGDAHMFDLNLPLDEFGTVDFDFVQNNLGK